jgi:hypothetical protein
MPPAPSLALVLPANRPEPSPAAPVTKQEPMVPDFRGKSMRDAMEAASERGIEVTVEGSGVAHAQLPLPGTPLHQGDRIRIIFTR